jgi:protein-L-isoaspartate O-methyltransferase
MRLSPLCFPRIITNRSGRYGWPNGSPADVYVFDADGKQVSEPRVEQVPAGGGVLTEVRIPSDHFAILVQKNRH